MTELKTVARDFYNMTGIKIVLYDDMRRVLYSYPNEMCDFCAEIRKDKMLAEKCISCDNIGFDVCEKTHKPYIYKCHMGLGEAIAPICENDIIIGYMMMGQILCDGEENIVENNVAVLSDDYSIDKNILSGGLSMLKSVNDEFISSALNMMSMCACYLYCNKIIQNKSEVLSVQLRDYVEKHLTEPLTVSILCKKLYLSKSKLYHLSKKAFGMGVSDYIRTRRIELAKELLCRTEMSISAIADKIGVGDANYFTRIFKNETGMTPREYKQLIS